MKNTKDILIGGIVVVAIAGYGIFAYLEQQEAQFNEVQAKFEAISIEQEIKATELLRIQQDNEAIVIAQNERIADAEAETKRVSQQKVTSNSISVAEMQPYMTAVVRVICNNGWGSGSILNNKMILTNRHVIQNERSCYFYSNSRYLGIDIYDTYVWNDVADVAVVPLKAPVYGLNTKVASLHNCSAKMPVGSPVVVIGYPKFAQGSQTVTEGIISGYQGANGLPYNNYYISAKMDSGNSGGISLSKDSQGVCSLGIPTWVSTGNYANQGVVQNIYNVQD